MESVSRMTTAEAYALPQEKELRSLINQFFGSVGTVLPYVNKSAVLAEYTLAQREKRLSRTFRALLNIIFAFASSSLQGWNHEVFYQRSLALLDDRVLCGANIELGNSAKSMFVPVKELRNT